MSDAEAVVEKKGRGRKVYSNNLLIYVAPNTPKKNIFPSKSHFLENLLVILFLSYSWKKDGGLQTCMPNLTLISTFILTIQSCIQ